MQALGYILMVTVAWMFWFLYWETLYNEDKISLDTLVHYTFFFPLFIILFTMGLILVLL